MTWGLQMEGQNGPKFAFPIPAFNFNDQHDLAAIVAAIEQCGQPAVAMVSVAAASYYDLELMYDIFAFYKRRSSVPLWIELDHCSDRSMLRRAAALHFDILMADFSHFTLQENIEYVADVVNEMRSYPCLVEGESSAIPTELMSGYVRNDELPPAELVHKFASETGCDLVAPYIGTLHGFMRVKPAIDEDFVRQIARAAPVPIVAHGCDYLTPREIGILCRSGVRKLNFGPQLRDIWCTASRMEWQVADTDIPDQRRVHSAANRALQVAITEIVGALRRTDLT